ncbi:tryptophan synthase subunit alpha [Alteribacillus iranensis]|uniref:Tryptophan synthase alpha chain n=1 Tax=Alteribacillus iranensis TaxID=930128 RepID=A0A1I1ZR32_9BACI|nr:tryptophan synthase subunit alpha [Alteribacillus iranensis]SFE34111.1 tryptophan synthase, alpha chain [Alteribacillus iranensis]
MSKNRVLEAASSATYPLFIPFIMAGDPNEEATIELALSLEDAGAHILELGIPYSDPLADGPVLQESAKRALLGGMNLKKAIDLVPVMRQRGLTIPVIIFTYYNPVLQMEEETFLHATKEAGADGILIPDLPYEESRNISAAAKERGLANISLVAPTSATRVETIAKEAEGFLYCVSSVGVTGTRDTFSPEVYSFVNQVKQHSHVPVAVGFGISRREHVESLKDVSDGVIVGSAIMKQVQAHVDDLANSSTRQNALDQIKGFVSSLISS